MFWRQGSTMCMIDEGHCPSPGGYMETGLQGGVEGTGENQAPAKLGENPRIFPEPLDIQRGAPWAMTQINYHLPPQILARILIRFNYTFFPSPLHAGIYLISLELPFVFAYPALGKCYNPTCHFALCSHCHSQLKTCDSGQCSIRNEAKGRSARILTLRAFPELGRFGWRRP